MLLNRTTLSLAKLASKEESRYSLHAIAIEKECATVTEGHYLVNVTHPTDNHNDDSFPQVAGLEHLSVNGDVVLVHRDAALEALKALPKRTNIPQLANAAMGTDGKLYTTDLENVGQFKYQTEGKFPNWRAVMPSGDVKATVTLDAGHLKLLMEFFKEHAASTYDGTGVKITIYEKEYSAVKFESKGQDGQEITAILMPTRCDA